jgi:outer membrane protein assembly factor BamB
MKGLKQLVIESKHIWRGFLPALVVFFTSGLYGQQWSRFRGPDGQGISQAKTIPIKWTENDYAWKVELPGTGHSSPVVWGNKVFVTSGDNKAALGILLALSASDGQVLWQKQYKLASYPVNRLNSYATATPAVDADYVYVLWPTSKETILVALDHSGQEAWKRTFEGVRCQHGAGSSPIVTGDMVVFTIEHEADTNDMDSAWIAVDRRTGQTRWQLPRQTNPKTSYSTPCVYSPTSGRPQLTRHSPAVRLAGKSGGLIFTSFAHGISSVDPETGAVLWEMESAFVSRVISSPVIADGLVIGTCGDAGAGKRLIAIRPGTGGKSTQPAEIYKIDSSTIPYIPTSLAKEDLLFTFNDRGYVSCLRSATGEQLWREKPAAKFYGSPVWADGRLYCIAANGDVLVIKAAPTYELLAVNPLGEQSHTTPAISGERMYLRTYSHLAAVGRGKQ